MITIMGTQVSYNAIFWIGFWLVMMGLLLTPCYFFDPKPTNQKEDSWEAYFNGEIDV